ncbi:citramalyl-CoA lyase, mitochondrial isoform X5 [Sphaerodactylus townsendi]|uniref:citramalyl-CoA lyase, mitochondrial isoform X5 n=1 Tax=Sphaerodactylus townsendi TaxID=933632 RepID=UPI002026AC14|nr:citramalyl-CoA lyase, mitochondrial isoform X5 [Sphaerodactylus townsendi]
MMATAMRMTRAGLHCLSAAGSSLRRWRLKNSLLSVAIFKLDFHWTQSRNYIPRRAVLYVPADDERKIQKIPSLKVDCAVLDCEDGVALNRKGEARTTTMKALQGFEFGQTEKCVRINSVSSGLAEEDMKVILVSNVLPTSLMLPKVENVEEIRWFTEKFASLTKGRTLVEPMRFIPFVETAMGLLNFKAIDLVYIDFQDEEGLRKQSREGALMGFTGKQVIHPKQIAVVQEEFSPSPEKIKWAHELMAAFDEHQHKGKGAFTFRGSMIDMPLLKQAQNIVTLATAIKKK